MPAFTGHTTGQADFPHPALGQDFTFHVQRHLQLLNSSELIGCPISRSFTTYCVCLDTLRSLPSTGVTRLPQYYEPLRHPGRPACPSRASGWSSLTTPWGFPCFVRFPCVHAAATTPAQRLNVSLRSFRPDVSVFPERVVGSTCALSFSRIARRSRCGLHTRAVTNLRHANRRLQPLRYLHDCSDCFRLERLPGGACTRWKALPCHGAHPFRTLNHRKPSILMTFIASHECNPAKDDKMPRQHQIAMEDLRRCAHM
jgi:hypothetical protein